MRAYEIEIQNCPYSKSTMFCASLNPSMVTWLMTACSAVVTSSKPQSIQLPQQYSSYHVAVSHIPRNSVIIQSIIIVSGINHRLLMSPRNMALRWKKMDPTIFWSLVNTSNGRIFCWTKLSNDSKLSPMDVVSMLHVSEGNSIWIRYYVYEVLYRHDRFF